MPREAGLLDGRSRVVGASRSPRESAEQHHGARSFAAGWLVRLGFIPFILQINWRSPLALSTAPGAV